MRADSSRRIRVLLMATISLKDWKRFEGRDLAGEYNLQECLGESDSAAFFRATYGEDAKPALLKLMPAETVDPAAQLELWNRISRLSHPHLLRLLDFGHGEDTGKSFLYAIFEFPEDRLTTALEQAPLTETEASEVRAAVAEALGYIHSQGLVHGAVDAGHIVAVGNQIKLASDTLREASASHTATQDLQQLDELLPESIASPPTPAAAPVVSVPRRSFPAWASGAMVVLLGILGYVFLPKSEPQPPRRSIAPSQTAPQPPARAISPSQTAPQPAARPPAPRQLEAASPTPAPARDVPKSIPAPASAPGPQNWRVIAYTYFSRQAAERRADSINQKWPDAKAEVFVPSSGRSAYLVALGGWFTRDDAVRFLKISRGKGLPRDIYVQNYTR